MGGIFKAYDIRGVYPDQLNEETANKIGRAFCEFLKETQEEEQSRPLRIAIGRDNRVSSESLKDKVVEGIRDQGGDVIDIGLSTTPMFYFAVAHYKFDGGIMVTASHNPPQFNGFKIVRENAVCIGENNGLNRIKELTQKTLLPNKKGNLIEQNVIGDYVDSTIKQVDLSEVKPLKLVIDTGNAVPGILVSEFFKNTGLEVEHIFSELDGNFPNHNPDPLIEENLSALKKEVSEKEADLGIAFDGDGDRVVFVNKKGEVIPSDFITCLISKMVLKEKPGSKILYNICSSKIIREIVEENGGTPILWKTGHTFIKDKMEKEGIVFAGEFSGHYYLQQGEEKKYYCEAPFYVVFRVLEKISKENKPISELVSPFEKYYHSGEVNFEVEKKEAKMKELEKEYSEGEVSHLDGVKVEFDDWWFNVRPSNTENLLRLVVEAEDKETLDNKLEEIRSIIKS